MSWIVFDVDGVLIDVNGSYDVAVKRTVEQLLDAMGITYRLDLKDIRRLRIKGIFPDDFDLCEAFALGLPEYGDDLVEKYPNGEDVSWIRKIRGIGMKRSTIKDIFNTYYLGNEFDDRLFDTEGLYTREKGIVDTDMLKEAESNFELGVITGRDHLEMKLAEDVMGYRFERKVTRDMAVKPDPCCFDRLGADQGVYIGDTETDRRLVEEYNKKMGKGFEFYRVDGSCDVNQVLAELLD